MGVVALADFGSTYTKVRLVDPAQGELLARAEAPTTVATDLMEGYGAALEAALRSLGAGPTIDEQLAVSSAGGGLRVAAVGLVADLTAAAARQAALNAGARVEAVLAGTLGDEQLIGCRRRNRRSSSSPGERMAARLSWCWTTRGASLRAGSVATRSSPATRPSPRRWRRSCEGEDPASR